MNESSVAELKKALRELRKSSMVLTHQLDLYALEDIDFESLLSNLENYFYEIYNLTNV